MFDPDTTTATFSPASGKPGDERGHGGGAGTLRDDALLREQPADGLGNGGFGREHHAADEASHEIECDRVRVHVSGQAVGERRVNLDLDDAAGLERLVEGRRGLGTRRRRRRRVQPPAPWRRSRCRSRDRRRRRARGSCRPPASPRESPGHGGGAGNHVGMTVRRDVGCAGSPPRTPWPCARRPRMSEQAAGRPRGARCSRASPWEPIRGVKTTSFEAEPFGGERHRAAVVPGRRGDDRAAAGAAAPGRRSRNAAVAFTAPRILNELVTCSDSSFSRTSASAQAPTARPRTEAVCA